MFEKGEITRANFQLVGFSSAHLSQTSNPGLSILVVNTLTHLLPIYDTKCMSFLFFFSPINKVHLPREGGEFCPRKDEFSFSVYYNYYPTLKRLATSLDNLRILTFRTLKKWSLFSVSFSSHSPQLNLFFLFLFLLILQPGLLLLLYLGQVFFVGLWTDYSHLICFATLLAFPSPPFFW